mmetsp:Transcript_88168/g.227344  ORF Transcript_88168/g.227344 Transcript_88168/m.227344 type:complete len:352 (-) Transcript_88168:67-1122(-)
MDALNGVALRGICSLYFENHVSPLLGMIQKAQDRFDGQLQDLQAKVEGKANAREVPTLAQFEELAARGAWINDTNTVPTLARLQNLSAAMQRKANCSDVPTIQQMRKLADQATQLDQKANETAELVAALEQKVAARVSVGGTDDVDAAMARMKELDARLGHKADSANVATLKHLESLREELLAREKRRVPTSPAMATTPPTPRDVGSPEKGSDFKKVQVIFAAAAARFEKQLKEVRQQIRELRESREEAPPTGVTDERWPGRRLSTGSLTSPRPMGDAASDAGSDLQSDIGSASIAGSALGLGPEEKAELRRIQTIVGAAGTAFSKELRELRGHIGELRGELQGVKARLDA